MNESACELQPRRVGHLFAGAGGRILADLILGDVPVFAVEIERYCQEVIAARHNDGALPWFPVFDDVQTFDGRPWRGLIDLLTGGFPCQDISCAGTGKGLAGERSGLWGEFARIIDEVRPQRVEIENSPMLASPRSFKARLLEMVGSLFGSTRHKRDITLRKRPDILRILEDLSKMGYDAKWGVIGAHHAGAPHKRNRIWIIATDSNEGECRQGGGRESRWIQYSGGCKAKLDVEDSKLSRVRYQGREARNKKRGGTRKQLSSLRQGDGKVSANRVKSAGADISYSAGKRCSEARGVRYSKPPERSASCGEEVRNLSNSVCYGLQGRRGERGVERQARLRRRARSNQVQKLSTARHKRNEQRLRKLRKDKQARRRRLYLRGGATIDEVGEWWSAEPDVGRVAHGVANRVDRLKSIGNGQVPLVAAIAEECV